MNVDGAKWLSGHHRGRSFLHEVLQTEVWNTRVVRPVALDNVQEHIGTLHESQRTHKVKRASTKCDQEGAHQTKVVEVWQPGGRHKIQVHK